MWYGCYPGEHFIKASGSRYDFAEPTDGASNGVDVVADDKSQITEIEGTTGRLVRVIEGSRYQLNDPHALALESGTLWVLNGATADDQRFIWCVRTIRRFRLRWRPTAIDLCFSLGCLDNRDSAP